MAPAFPAVIHAATLAMAHAVVGGVREAVSTRARNEGASVGAKGIIVPGILAAYPGWDGFLGTRGSWMLDTVFTAMLLAIPLMVASIGAVRYGRRYRLHKALQVATAVVLFTTVLAFEVDMRLTGWTDRARPSPYWQDGKWNDWIDWSLSVHLLFAIPTLFLWAWVTIQAWRKFPRPAAPGTHSRPHRVAGRLAAIGLTLTAITGWWFYWLAFVATAG